MADKKISDESILAQFTHKNVTQINGEPTHCNLKVTEKEITENLTSVWCTWGNRKENI